MDFLDFVVILRLHRYTWPVYSSIKLTLCLSRVLNHDLLFA